MLNIVLLEPEIPQNTGNIMRTCVATHTHLHLIKPLGFSMDEKSIKRSGVNYIENCKWTLYENWEDFVSKNDGVYYFYTRYGHKPHSDLNYTDEANDNKNIYLVFGKESTGIPKEILSKDLDHCLRIPINSNIRALNVSNSVAIMVYEVLRQQDFNDLLFKEPHKSEDFIIED